MSRHLGRHTLSGTAVLAGLCIVALALSIAGCWDGREVDDIAFITAIGLDDAPGNQIFVTFHMAVPRAATGGEGGGDGQRQTSLITTLLGRSILGVLDVVNSYVDRSPSLVHGKLVVIGEALARRGVSPYISELARFRETRRTMFLVIVKGTAREFMEMNRPILEGNPAKNLELLALANRRTGLVPASQLHRFLVEMQSLSGEPIAILAGIRREGSTGGAEPVGTGGEPGKPPEFPPLPSRPGRTDSDYIAGESPRIGGNPVEFLGAAVFRADRMVGEITGREVVAVLMLRGTLKRATLVTQDPFVPDRYVTSDLRLARPTQVRVTRNGRNFQVQADVRLEGEVVGTQTQVDYSNPKNLHILEQRIAQDAEEFFEDTVRKAQRDFGADIFTFGNKARHATLTWQEWAQVEWLSRFPEASVDVRVSVTLRRTGLLFKPPTPPPHRPQAADGR